MITEFKETDAVVSHEYEYAILLNPASVELAYLIPKINGIKQVEFRGNYSIVTVHYADKGGTRKLTTGVNNIRLYSKLNS